MDNLTHSLVGALLGRAGLKRLTPRAMPALILSANLPDIDSFIARPLGLEPIAFHRGFTHGVGGLLIMPFVAAGLIWLWDRLRRFKSPPLDGEGQGWGEGRSHAKRDTHPLPTLPHRGGGIYLPGLILACFLGTLSHPLLDWMNTYGIQLLAPLSGHWFHADTLFILDPWIWLMLILGLEMSWRAERLGRSWTRPALWAFAAALGYIGINAAISLRAEALARPLVARVSEPRIIVAGEVPLEFWKRRIVWRGDGVGGTGTYEPLKGLNRLALDSRVYPLNLDDPRLTAAARADTRVRGFLAWSWMPMVDIRGGRALLTDQRFYDDARRIRTDAFRIPLDNGRPSS
ncbi:MAG: metal-dependent hydrolase [Pseudomonadota bacterium]